MTGPAALPERQVARGATGLDASPVPQDFGDPAHELVAAIEHVALVDRSDLDRIRATGPDILDLLQRLGTGDLSKIESGRGRSTVLTSPKGRIVERLFVHRVGEHDVLLVIGRERSGHVLAHLARYTFAERTGLEPATGATRQFALIGPAGAAALKAAGLPAPDPCATLAATLGGARVIVLGEDGWSATGISVLTDVAGAGPVWDALADAAVTTGGRPAGAIAAEAWRVLRGLPAAGHELTEDYNPLEAGLWEAVAFDKGCYVGQEVVARLRTYDKVSRDLVGLRLPAEAAVPLHGTPICCEGREVGRVTSAVLPPGQSAPVALAYVKRRAREGADAAFRLGTDGPAVEIAALPFDPLTPPA